MFKRSLILGLAVAALCVAGTPAFAGSKSYNSCQTQPGGDCTQFWFSGNGGKKMSYQFTKDSITVTATGGTFKYSNGNFYGNQKVGQYSHGLGVTNNKQSNDSHTVDGINNTYQDVLILTFNKTVSLGKLYFGWTDSKDKVEVLAGDLTTSLGSYGFKYVGNGYYKVVLPDGIIGNSFGLRASGKHDSWKVKGAAVSAIPTPGAGMAGLALLGLVVAGRRRATRIG